MDTKLTNSFEYLPGLEVEGGDGGSYDLLSAFIKETGADPSLAQDILSMAENSFEVALEMYKGMMGPSPASQQVLAEQPGEVPDETQSSKRRARKKRRKGIVCVAEEVTARFREEAKYKCSKVDVGEELVPVIDDKFFQHTFLFPDLSAFTPPELVQFLSEDLTELSHLKALERTGRLNWWSTSGQCPPLCPLATSGDGNCLLHAASLGMWGVPDSSLILRSAVHAFLQGSPESAGVRRRWRQQVGRQFQEHGGFTLGEEEWEREWAELIRIARTEERPGAPKGAGPGGSSSLRRNSTLRPSYESLEEVHVLALAHVLKRPVIVLANTTLRDMHGQDFAPIYFSGVYLPLEYNPKHCFKSPVVLAYEGAHFSPLLVRDTPPGKPASKVLKVALRNQAVIPLVSPDGHMLPLQFVVDPKKDNIDEHKKMAADVLRGEMPSEYITLLESYTDVRWTSLSSRKVSVGGVAPPTTSPAPSAVPWEVPSVRFPAAQILYQNRLPYQESLLQSYYREARQRFEEHRQEQAERAEERARAQERAQREGPGQWERMPCRGPGCDMFGSHETGFLCSQCHLKQQGGGGGKGESPPPASPTSSDPASSGSSSGGGGTTSVASTRVATVVDDDDLPPPYPHRKVSSPHVAASTQPETSDGPSPAHIGTDPTPDQSGSGPLPDQSGSGPSADQSGTGPIAGAPQVAGPSPPSDRPVLSAKASAVASRIAESVRRSPPLATKRTPFTRGYSRDHVQPLGRDEVPDELGTGSKKRPVCKSEGCDFFAAEHYQGFCSKCSKSQQA